MRDEFDRSSTDDADIVADTNSKVCRKCHQESKSLETRDTGLETDVDVPDMTIEFDIPDDIADYISPYILDLGPQTLKTCSCGKLSPRASYIYENHSSTCDDEPETPCNENWEMYDDDWETYDKQATCDCGGSQCYCKEVPLDTHDDESHTADDSLDRSKNVCRCIKWGDVGYCECDYPIEGLDTGDVVGLDGADDEEVQDEEEQDEEVEDDEEEDEEEDED
ncbi:hypothetical protein FSARC_5385 [Fusarium sarcochroum]|uniref:Uncharacterized protein n=1 Tax=Fusarium sarcochroum TaxID=1208366 RepID=A0A8H4U005_9HYPO|nr:hypothetical protein FSARC_5385 [Fusarium sarcochroum]